MEGSSAVAAFLEIGLETISIWAVLLLFSWLLRREEFLEHPHVVVPSDIAPVCDFNLSVYLINSGIQTLFPPEIIPFFPCS